MIGKHKTTLLLTNDITTDKKGLQSQNFYSFRSPNNQN